MQTLSPLLIVARVGLGLTHGNLSSQLSHGGNATTQLSTARFGTESNTLRVDIHRTAVSDYDNMRKPVVARIKAVPGTEKGDPVKAMRAIVDVVRGEGVAKGRAWPGLLILGEDADADVRAKLQKTEQTLDAWADVTRGVSFDNAGQ